MNASLQSAGRLRGQAQGNRPMRKMPQSALSRQQKPVFAVLESAAIENEAAEAKETRRSEKARFERICKDQISFAFSFPLCDLLICELENPQVFHENELSENSSTERSEIVTNFNSLSTGNGKEPHLRAIKSVRRVTESRGLATNNCSRATLVSLADFVYSRVIARSIKTFWPNQKKNPKYVLAYVEETLECGHVVDIHPSDIEKLVARKRQCHECQKFFGGLDLKKPANGAKAAQRSRATGKVNWPSVAFALAAAVVIAIIGYYKAPKSYIYAAPTDVWRILSDVTPTTAGYEVIMQRVHEGRALPPWEMHFCSDYRPLFEVGMSLNWFAYEDRGQCISIARKDLGYVIDRGPDTWPKLAKNYWYFDNPSVAWGKSSICNGKPHFD